MDQQALESVPDVAREGVPGPGTGRAAGIVISGAEPSPAAAR